MQKYLCKIHWQNCWKVMLISYWTLSSFVSCAQIDTSSIKLTLGMSGNVQTGNFERLQFINQLDVSISTRNKRWNFQTNHLYLYQNVFGRLSQNDYLGRNFVTYYLTKRWDVFAAALIESYYIKGINLHYQVGVGTRYSLVKHPRYWIQLGLLASYGNKQYRSANFVDFEHPTPNLQVIYLSPVLKVQLAIIPKYLQFKLLFWYQQSLNTLQNWRFNLEAVLAVPIYKGLSLQVRLNNFYEHLNLEGVRPNDLFLTYGLNYKFQQ